MSVFGKIEKLVIRNYSRHKLFVVLLFFAVMFMIGRHIIRPSNDSSHDEIPQQFVVNPTTSPSPPLCDCQKEIPSADESIRSTDPQAFQWCSLESSIRGKHQKVIAYTLYGDLLNASIAKRYYSLMENISMTAKEYYPGWVIRIYHNIEDKDTVAHHHLCEIYCRFQDVDLCSLPLLIERIGKLNHTVQSIDPALLSNLNPRMYRFLVMLDRNVDVFISRDIDSLIWAREVDAVNEWLQSGYTFHVMRDHIYHYAIILAGMWGAKLAQRRHLTEDLTRALIQSGQNQFKGQDQTSLDNILWPVAKYDVMAHDSYHCQNDDLIKVSPIKVLPFPTQRIGSYFVGQVGTELNAEKCLEACRPLEHQDWEYC